VCLPGGVLQKRSGLEPWQWCRRCSHSGRVLGALCPAPGSKALVASRSFPLRLIRPISPGRKRKTGPLCSSQPHKGPALYCLAAIPNGCKGHFRSFGEVSLCIRVAIRRRQFLCRGYDYFFFFEVFFATFLVAAFAVFFAFFAFLAMWSSVKNWLSEHTHAVYRHAQH
jgi:hypothetical protein